MYLYKLFLLFFDTQLTNEINPINYKIYFI